MRVGSGSRSSAIKALRLTRSPRKLGNDRPSRTSSLALRGLAYCPAIRPTRITGFLSPAVSTSDICSRILSFWTIISDWHSSKLSAQSPPCNRKALPCWARASLALSSSISQLVTSGGSFDNSATAACRRSGSLYSGCWLTWRFCQLVGLQSVIGLVAAIGARLYTAEAPAENYRRVKPAGNLPRLDRHFGPDNAVIMSP